MERVHSVNIVTVVSEKSIQSDEETNDDHAKDTEEIIYREGNDANDITVLPPCDTLADHNIQVVRNRSTPSLNTEKGIVALYAFDMALCD